MTDTTDDAEFWGRQLLRKSQVQPLRAQMQEFIAEHEVSTDFKELRREVADGQNLSDFVEEEREERL